MAKVHKTSTFKQYLGENNPLTVCGIDVSQTPAGNWYLWHRNWAKVTCKACLKARREGK